jgi:superfamily II DNA or RNA helicase
MAFNRSIRFPSSATPRGASLTEKLGDYFNQLVQVKGETYFLQGRVVITKGSAAVVTGRVRGTRPYSVSLAYENGVVKAQCECPYFASSGGCKHLWATLLMAESQTFLSDAAATPRLTMVDPEGLDVEVGEAASGPVTSRLPETARPPGPRLPDWRRQIEQIADPRLPAIFDPGVARPEWPEKREVLYFVNTLASRAKGGLLILDMETRDRKADGSYSRPAGLKMRRDQIGQVPAEEDREALAALAGGRQHSSFSLGYGYDALPEAFALTPELARLVMPLAVRTGRCFLREGRETSAQPLQWDAGMPWRLALRLQRTKRGWGAVGMLRRGAEVLPLSEPALITQGGFVFHENRVYGLDKNAPFAWVLWLRSHGMLEAPEGDTGEFLGHLLCTRGMPAIEAPAELRFEEMVGSPQPALRFNGLEPNARGSRLFAELSFDYGGRRIEEKAEATGWYDPQKRLLLRRDAAAEEAAVRTLGELGMRFQSEYGRQPREAWEIAQSRLAGAIRALVELGWSIEADGRMFRRPGTFRMQVSTGVDWFELHGDVEYGESSARLPELLAALRRGDNAVRLEDGSYGLLPEEWLRRISMIAGMGAAEEDHLRFARSQAGLLDALLAAQPEATWDATFAKVRAELRSFEGIAPVDQPAGFQGQLREYQREGLGWIEFLRRFSFGGCLADDMGTGKTAQVLALLEMRRTAKNGKGASRRPSLVVVPRSLIFNWKEEALRFTPELRFLDYSGPERNAADIPRYDVVLTTYGTLRRDIEVLKDIAFDYAVLDEAQTVKNSGSEGAKAVRLLRAEHRLALSGTPVENHLGELWSLFEFLNPGMLGSASVFRLAGGAARNPDEGARQMLALAVRPFILRRTKEQVAKELPERTEQTIYCELGPAQRKLYNELRDHYRDSLRLRIETDGLGKSKIMVLEALLRLRQAACHPGLIDPKKTAEPSAKLEALMERLEEVLETGHKALVFSQFTSLLAIVRAKLDGKGMVYEYLDGKTRDRQQRVERFQNDSECKLFLISLKAGGLGLNLTAADYVFLLDPWWNPAVEAQAIDRAHRIGQTRHVSAYRLIARDTVEEKVLELQKTKRDLAAAIIGANNSVLRDLKREDLELLLS